MLWPPPPAPTLGLSTHPHLFIAADLNEMFHASLEVINHGCSLIDLLPHLVEDPQLSPG